MQKTSSSQIQLTKPLLLKNKSSTNKLFRLIFYLKWILYLVLTFCWVVGFIFIGVKLLNINNLKQTGIKFILIGLVPVGLLLLYIGIRHWTHGKFDREIFKCKCD